MSTVFVRVPNATLSPLLPKRSHVFCEHLSQGDDSACNPRPTSLRQAETNPLNAGRNDLANHSHPCVRLYRHDTKRLVTLALIYRNMYTGIEMGSWLKPVRWIGTSLSDLRSFPRPVRIDIGHALFAAQEGKTDPAAKPLKGFGGARVLEIVASHQSNTCRPVYTVRFLDVIYVLHVFQK